MMLRFFDDFLGKRARGGFAHIAAELFHEGADRCEGQGLILREGRLSKGSTRWKNRGRKGQAGYFKQAAPRENRACFGGLLVGLLVGFHCASPGGQTTPLKETRGAKKAAAPRTDDMPQRNLAPEKRINFSLERWPPSSLALTALATPRVPS